MIQVRNINRLKFKFYFIAVGKSNILSRYTYGKFNPEHEITIGCEFMAKNIFVKDRNVRIQIWDTAGQEAFRSITRSYYKNSTCAFIVYDISDKKTFLNVASWLQECREMCYKNIQIYLIGNKCDLEDKRQVSRNEGEQFAQENGLIFFETSALSGTNIEEVFVQSATEIIDKLESGKLQNEIVSSGIKIFNYPNKEIEEKMGKKSKGCC